jgi:hypothetical protein
MRHTGTSRTADGDGIARQISVGDGREAAIFLVPDVNEFDAPIAPQRVDCRVEGIADDPIASAHSRSVQ